MSKGWYPVVDMDKCSGCGICYNFCPNGVYAEKDGFPVVVNPDNCVQGCHGCEFKCGFGAIRYEGDSGIPAGGMIEIAD